MMKKEMRLTQVDVKGLKKHLPCKINNCRLVERKKQTSAEMLVLTVELMSWLVEIFLYPGLRA